MSAINLSLATPDEWVHLAPSGVLTEDTALNTGDGKCFRLVQVGKIVGPVKLKDHKGTTHTFSLDFLLNTSGQILGQWSAIVASGTTSYDFHCGK